MAEGIRLVIRTPHGDVLDARVGSARLPTPTGQVGLRQRQEPFVLVVEPGLVLLSTGADTRYAATAGGLLDADREGAVIYTPFAVAGERDTDVLDALDRALSTPDSELSARRRLIELERHIIREVRHRPGPARAGDGLD